MVGPQTPAPPYPNSRPQSPYCVAKLTERLAGTQQPSGVSSKQMRTDLTERLHSYLNSVSEQKPAATRLYADALSSSNAAAAAASASIICSHTRILRGNSELSGRAPGLDEIEILIGAKQAQHPADEATGQKPSDEVPAQRKI